MPKIFHRYNYKQKKLKFNKPTRTKQSFKDEVNVNYIIEKFHSTGLLSWVNTTQHKFEDVSSAQDYQMSVNMILEANDMFDELPANIRKRFDNEPFKLLQFLEDGNNLEEAVALGLINEQINPEVPTAPPSPTPDKAE